MRLCFLSFILCIIIIIPSGYGFSRRGEVDETGIQSAHSGFIPLYVIFDLGAEQFTLLILSDTPVISVELAEDLSHGTHR